MTSSDHELNAWIDEWQAGTAPNPAAEQIRQFVRRRSRLHLVFAIADSVIGVGMLLFLIHRVATQTDPWEQLAMGLLAVITVGATMFGWTNWRGAMAARGEDTATFVALAVSRVRRLERSVRAAWWILGAQFLVFAPWIWHRLYADAARPSLGAQLWSWGLLALMMSLAVGFVVAMQRWSKREARIVAELQQELNL